ncbi:MAG: MATE family efflux transporter [Firmicutes bacterium]|nr:MATE family efflux transporter [Bacillota bacterium]MDY2808592.1 MATE family efflux transporter [Oscillospiraceae bacterium]
MPIRKLLISMSLPMMASMLVQALYNIVDSIFVARVSEAALTAVSISFPIQNLMIAFGVGIGVGVNALLSKSLGEGDQPRAQRIALQGIFIEVICCAIFILVGIFAMDLFFRGQTADAEIIALGKDYLSICCIFSVGLFAQLIFERLLQATGRTVLSMISQCAGALINIIFDPILIFGVSWLGIPAMGVTGAAIATVFGQIVGGIVAIVLNVRRNRELDLRFRGFRPDGKLCGSILFIGIPSAIMGSIGSFMTYGVNKILFAFEEVGKTAAAVFGVYFKLQSFVFMPVFGLNNGMVPIVSYNYGAKRPDRITQTIRLSAIYAVAIMAAGVAVVQLIPDKLLLLFDASEQMLTIGVPALRIISTCFVFAGFSIVCSSVFQALGNSIFSMIMSITRQLAVLLPAAYILAHAFGLHAVWYAFPIAEFASLALSIIMLSHTYKKVIMPLAAD